MPINSKTSSGSIPKANFSSSSTPNNVTNCSDLLIVFNSSDVIVAICSGCDNILLGDGCCDVEVCEIEGENALHCDVAAAVSIIA